MHAPTTQSGHEILTDPKTLEAYDAILFGIPTRYGNFPAQWKVFWDKTGGQWQNGSYWGKYAGVFVGTATQGGGQESTAMNAMSTFVHHGFIFVPLGYKTSFAILGDNSEVRGGSPWGAGTFSVSIPRSWSCEFAFSSPSRKRIALLMTCSFHFQGGDGSRMPSQKELDLATIQGEAFYNAVKKSNVA